MTERTRRNVGVAVAGFTTFVNLYTPQAILPQLAADLGIDQPHSSLAVTVALLAVALVAPFAGAASDRFGRKRLMVAAAFAVTVPTLLAATAPSLPVLLVWRFLQGLLLPFIFAVAVAYIGEECEGAEAVRTTGLYASGTIVGGFSGRFISGIAAELGGWRAAFVTLALVTLVAAAAMTWLLPGRSERSGRWRAAGAARSPATRGICGTAGCWAPVPSGSGCCSRWWRRSPS